MTDRESPTHSKIIEVMARAIATDGNRTLAVDRYWVSEVEHYRKMVAEYGTPYKNGRSTITDAFREAEAVYSHFQASGMAVVGWRPIESAPKDGKSFLGWFPNLNLVRLCSYVGGYDSGDCWWRDGCIDYSGPTHWQPLPASPSGKALEKEMKDG